MRSIAITRNGGPEVLALREAPDPQPGPGQVLVEVRAAGINFADILMRMGLYPGAPALPFVPGYEACGTVLSGALPKGSRVVVPTNFGGYADRVVAAADEVFPLPDGASFEEGAALTVNYLTAYLALFEEGRLRKGQTALVHGAAGGVGVAACQLARSAGARVIGTASASKHEAAKAQGAEHMIDYRTQDFEAETLRLTGGKGVNVALDPIGGESFRKSYRCLGPGGKLILFGFSAAAGGERRNLLKVGLEWWRTPRFDPFDLMMTNKSVVGLHLGRMTHERERLKTAMAELVKLWAAGKIKPVVGASFAAPEAGKAHEYIQSRRSVGKVVLTWP